MAEEGVEKVVRILSMYTRLMNGSVINKAEEANNYKVNERSIQRDIDDIRNFLSMNVENDGVINSVIYDRMQKGYRLEKLYCLKLSNGEILAVCKILLESRSLPKKQMEEILDKLVECCIPEKNQKIVKDLIANEKFHYVEPRHQKQFLDMMWDIGEAIRECRYLEIDYERIKDKKTVHRKIKPVAILFSEYYFYITAFIEDEKIKKDFDVINDAYPTIYRMDRISRIKVLNDRFHIPYSNRFEEGEFRKRIQFMFGGKLQKIKFKYLGNDLDSILDRLPTAQVIAEENDGFLIEAEVFGTGIEMWIRSQGDLIEIR